MTDRARKLLTDAMELPLPERAELVAFVELSTRFRILAGAHARRRPFYWRERR